MTDGGIVLDDRGVQTKRYHVRDGTGLAIWRRLGYETCLITGRTSQALVHRAQELGITHVVQGSRDKAASLAEVLGTLGLDERQAACLADDLPDLPMMKRTGYPMAVADAVPEVRALARFVTTLPGGQGAVREAIEHLLKEKDRWSEAVELFQ